MALRAACRLRSVVGAVLSRSSKHVAPAYSKGCGAGSFSATSSSETPFKSSFRSLNRCFSSFTVVDPVSQIDMEDEHQVRKVMEEHEMNSRNCSAAPDWLPLLPGGSYWVPPPAPPPLLPMSEAECLATIMPSGLPVIETWLTSAGGESTSTSVLDCGQSSSMAATPLFFLFDAPPAQVEVFEMPPSAAIEEIQAPSTATEEAPLQCHTKRTYQPSVIKKKRRHGFFSRKCSVGGRKVIARRLAKGRRRLAS